MKNSIGIVIPNYNGVALIEAAIESLLGQSLNVEIVVVENGSTDGSAEFIASKYPDVTLLKNMRNLGFAGGVNTGIRYLLGKDVSYVGLLNNDAIADKDWAASLVERMKVNRKAGIVTSKIVDKEGSHIDSVGDYYTAWGLPYPEGRDQKDAQQFNEAREVFAGSGGASVYRADMLREIGLFDEDFFAYYEDVDLSFRAQLAGWKVWFEPKAIVYHDTGSTSKKIKGFTTYQTIKNLPWLLWKNVPGSLLLKIWPRFFVAHLFFIVSAFQRGQFWSAIKGILVTTTLFPKKLYQRYKIQSSRKVSVDYVENITVYDLPPNATRLRKFRSILRLKY